MNNKDYKNLIIKILLLIIGILYILFLYLDCSNKTIFISTDNIKFICIILCFIITLLTGKDSLSKRDLFLLQIGLFFTVIADYFFLIEHKYTLGVLSFCIVQIIYSIRHDIQKKDVTIRNYMIIFLTVFSSYLIINTFIIKIDLLFVVGFYYSMALITSVAKAIKARKNNLYPYPNKHMIAWGMILFLLCDINVGLANITKVVNLSQSLLKTFLDKSFLLIWLFYLPSQVLLALSGYKYFHKF